MQTVITVLTFGKRGVNIMSYKISDDAKLVQQLDTEIEVDKGVYDSAETCGFF